MTTECASFAGFATTSRVTSGSVAALYANVADKDWESDSDSACAGAFDDIASQLINSETGKQFKVDECSSLGNCN